MNSKNIKDMSTVVYIHGYKSSPTTDKVADLKKDFDHVVAPAVPLLFDEAEQHLSSFIEDLLLRDKDPVLVGTSLGGYWAARLAAKYKLSSVLVNPAIDPSFNLKQFSDPELTADELQKFVPLKPPVTPTIVLLAANDDVIQAAPSEALFDKVAEVVVYSDGGHRFQCPERISSAVTKLISFQGFGVVTE